MATNIQLMAAAMLVGISTTPYAQPAVVDQEAGAARAYIVLDISRLHPTNGHLQSHGMQGVALNERAQVVGMESWLSDGQVVDNAVVTGAEGLGGGRLPSPVDPADASANAINDAGLIVGSSAGWPFVSSSDGEAFRNLGSLAGLPGGGATAINDRGQIAGVSYVPGPGGSHLERAFITSVRGQPLVDIGTLGGATAHAYGINSNGVVIGDSVTADGVTHGFISGENGVGLRDLGSLGGAGLPSYARAINATGQVVGGSTAHGFVGMAFITGPDGRDMASPTRAFGFNPMLLGINDVGCAVGYTYLDSARSLAILVDRQRRMLPLNQLVDLPAGVWLTAAAAINAHGQIVASGSNSHVYLLTPNGVGECAVDR